MPGNHSVEQAYVGASTLEISIWQSTARRLNPERNFKVGAHAEFLRDLATLLNSTTVDLRSILLGC